MLEKKYFQILAGWFVHLFTASGAVIGLFALKAIYDHHYITALWLICTAVIVDSVDGSLARLTRVSEVVPKIDGALLDNIVDYFNYVIVPCFFILAHPSMLPDEVRGIIACLIVLSSAYQFTQKDAKTKDNFFKGFPCYWNFLILYFYLFNSSSNFNAILLLVFVILVFVPIKYVYPSRMDNLTRNPTLKKILVVLVVLFIPATLGLLWTYQEPNSICVGYSIFYNAIYLGFSIYRTLFPITKPDKR